MERRGAQQALAETVGILDRRFAAHGRPDAPTWFTGAHGFR